jgi:murein DD-endopeptidase MepM/ murein hydrolase activator NlpD
VDSRISIQTDQTNVSDGNSGYRRFLSLLVWGFVTLLGGALALAGFKFLPQSQVGPDGDLLSWTDFAAKEKLKAYLEANVKLEGFKLSVLRVERGQNYWSIARNAGISIDSLVGYNPDMQHFNAYVGRALLVGNRNGALHQVKSGESLESIAALYKVEPQTLRDTNYLGWRGLKAGQILFVLGASPKRLSPPMAELFEARSFIRSPLAGAYTSLMGYRVDPFNDEKRLHNGVDIRAPFNALVAAAADGVVSLAGWNGGYGKCVIIEHHNGFRTLYGHLNVILVRQGQRVKQHQYIGKVGMTGRTTGPHLHFTVWKDGKIQDPLKYLW